MTCMTIYHPCGEIEARAVHLDATPTYDELRTALRPVFGEHHPQRIRIVRGGRLGDMFVDERGHELGLPGNEAATAILRQALAEMPSQSELRDLAMIAGPAVVFSRQVWF